MKYSYTREMRCNEEIGEYAAFAIMAMNGTVCIRYIAEVFLEEEKARTFVSLCNRLKLDPLHLEDAIYDAIAAE